MCGILLIQWSTRQWKPWETEAWPSGQDPWKNLGGCDMQLRYFYIAELSMYDVAVEYTIYSYSPIVVNTISIIGSMSIKVGTGDPLLNSWLLGLRILRWFMNIFRFQIAHFQSSRLPYYRIPSEHIDAHMYNDTCIHDICSDFRSQKRSHFLKKISQKKPHWLPSKYSMNQCLLVLGDVAELHSC